MPEKSLNDLPRELRMIHTKATEALQRENYAYGVVLFAQILTKEPYIFECRKALRLAQNGKSGARGGFFKRAFSSASSSPMVAKGQMALRKNPLEAVQIAEQILNSDAQNPGAHRLIAEAALAADMPRTAVMSLELLLLNSPKDKGLNIKLAEAWILAGEKTKAENIFAELQREYPNDNEIFMALKNVSARKTLDEGGYEALSSGEGSYRDILKDKKEAVSLEQEKRQVKSEDVAGRLIEEKEARLKTEPDNVKLLRDLGDLYVQKNAFDRALEYYGKIAATDAGNDASLHRLIADTRVRQFNHAISQLDPAARRVTRKRSRRSTRNERLINWRSASSVRKDIPRICRFVSSWGSNILRRAKSARQSRNFKRRRTIPIAGSPR